MGPLERRCVGVAADGAAEAPLFSISDRMDIRGHQLHTYWSMHNAYDLMSMYQREQLLMHAIT
jgi:hypothetical protein